MVILRQVKCVYFSNLFQMSVDTIPVSALNPVPPVVAAAAAAAAQQPQVAAAATPAAADGAGVVSPGRSGVSPGAAAVSGAGSSANPAMALKVNQEVLTSLHLIKDIRRLEKYQRDFFLKVSLPGSG